MKEHIDHPTVVVAVETAVPSRDTSESRCVGSECRNYIGPEVCGCLAARTEVRIEPVPE